MNLVVQYAPGAAAQDVLREEMLDDPVEMANLTEDETGVPGIIYVSTRQGRHGPRIKWYPRRGGSGEAFLTVTLENPPRILNHGVPPREASSAVAAAEWAEMNRSALLRFWEEGTSLTFQEVGTFLRGLTKLP
ncbi:MAG: hypothetical protein K5Q68_00350 [Roseococcus sp.]|nr:hypothetical protein [Roseococcus sp.]